MTEDDRTKSVAVIESEDLGTKRVFFVASLTKEDV